MNQKTLFSKNISTLHRRNPALAAALAKRMKQGTGTRIKKRGINWDIFADDGSSYYSGNNPVSLARSDIAAADLTNPRILIVFGFGAGYTLTNFLNDHYQSSRTKRIIVIEKDLDVLCAGLQVADVSAHLLSGVLTIFGGVPSNRLYNTLYEFCLKNSDVKLMAKSIAILPSTPALRQDREYYVSAVRFFRQAVNQVLQNYGNSPEDSLWGLENLLSNIGDTLSYPGIIDMKNRYAGRPAVLVAAGPSLSKNINLLKDVRDRVFIICVDTALRILLRNGITPHMVTSIERGISTMNYYSDLGEYGSELEKICFAPATVVRHELYDTCVREYGMKPLIVYRDFAHYKWVVVDKGIIASGKSSANLAFKMLQTMGFTTIILVGQDLAFGPDEQTHVSGADHSIRGMKKSKKIKKVMWVEGNFVKKIKTIETWYHFKRYYENDITRYDGTVINATEGGAKIEGTDLMPLKKALSKCAAKQWDVSGPLTAVHDGFDPERISRDMRTVSDVIDRTISFCDDVMQTCRNGEEQIDAFRRELAQHTDGENVSFTDLDTQWLAGYADRLETMKQSMIDGRMFYLFLMHIVQSYVIRTEIAINDLPSHYEHANEINAAYIKVVSEWFPTIRKLAGISRQYLEKAQEQIRKRSQIIDEAV